MAFSSNSSRGKVLRGRPVTRPLDTRQRHTSPPGVVLPVHPNLSEQLLSADLALVGAHGPPIGQMAPAWQSASAVAHGAVMGHQQKTAFGSLDPKSIPAAASDKATFESIDSNGAGVLTEEELMAATVGNNQGTFGSLDPNRDGTTTGNEFILAAVGNNQATFGSVDPNRDGTITGKEFIPAALANNQASLRFPAPSAEGNQETVLKIVADDAYPAGAKPAWAKASQGFRAVSGQGNQEPLLKKTAADDASTATTAPDLPEIWQKMSRRRLQRLPSQGKWNANHELGRRSKMKAHTQALVARSAVSSWNRHLEKAPFFQDSDEEEADEEEDDKAKPTKGWSGLRGRKLTTTDEVLEAEGGFCADWVYQRFLNRITNGFLRVFTSREQAWYDCYVDGNDVMGVDVMQVVILVATIFSPLVFPFIYGPWLVILLLVTPAMLLEDDARWEHLRVLLECFWYFWLACFPGIYGIFVADVSCVMRQKCYDVNFHLSWMHLAMVPMSCMFAGFRFVHSICDTAIDSLCEVGQRHAVEKKPEFKEACEAVIKALSDPTDEMSFFPVYVKDQDVRHFRGLPHDSAKVLAICIASFVAAATPTLWMILFHNQSLTSASGLDLLLIATGLLGYAIEFSKTLLLLDDVVRRFSWAVDELLIWAFATANGDMKAMSKFRKLYQKTVRKQDEFRIKQDDYFSTFLDGKFHSLASKKEVKTHGRFDRFKLEPEEVCDSPDLNELGEELKNLRQDRVVFNLLEEDGVMFFRLMSDWLRYDILNQRTGLELFIGNTMILFVAMAFAAILVYLRQAGESFAVQVLLGSTCLPLLLYIAQSLNLCVSANTYLCKWQHKVLLAWEKDVITNQRLSEEKNAIAWVWDETQRPRARALYKEKDPQNLQAPPRDTPDAGYKRHVADMLSITRSAMATLQSEQQILGVAITAEVRTRFIAALAAQLFSMGGFIIASAKAVCG